MPLNKIQQKLVEDNMGIVGTVINENVRDVNNLDMFTYQDIFQIGCEGLCKAALKYMPDKGKFSTCAYIYIRNEIFNALGYMTSRRREIVADDETVLDLIAAHDDRFENASFELGDRLDAAKSRATGVVAKGIDAIRLMAAGYKCREIGEMMGGVSANNVTAWVARARAFLKDEPDIASFRETG